MGNLTLSDFRTQLTLGLLDRTDISTTQLNTWINQAYQHVADPGIYPHKEMMSSGTITLTATDTYDLTVVLTRYYAIRWIRSNTDNKLLIPTSDEKLNQSTKPTGKPSKYAIWGRWLELDTTPATGNGVGDVLQVRYWNRLAILSADNSTTELGWWWDPVVVQGSVYYAYLGLGQAERADFHRENFAALINEVSVRPDLESEAEGQQFHVDIEDYQRP